MGRVAEEVTQISDDQMRQTGIQDVSERFRRKAKDQLN